MKVIVDGQLVHYQDEGKGKVMLLLHGWGANLKTFDALSQAFAGSYRVIRLDLPGFGESPRPNKAWRIDDYARFIARFLEKIKVDAVYAVAGHSFGGRITIKATSRGYITPKKIVLMGSAGVRAPLTLKQRLYKAAAKTGKAATQVPGLRSARRSLQRRLYASAGTTDYLDAGASGMREIFLNTINEDLRADAAKITQQSLLIWGEQDEDTPIAYAKEFQKEIAGSKLHIIPNAGHFVYLDAPQDAVQLTDEFLK
jgi:pimeloyl-ACP methyl ester carboxylesterase